MVISPNSYNHLNKLKEGNPQALREFELKSEKLDDTFDMIRQGIESSSPKDIAPIVNFVREVAALQSSDKGQEKLNDLLEDYGIDSLEYSHREETAVGGWKKEIHNLKLKGGEDGSMVFPRSISMTVNEPNRDYPTGNSINTTMFFDNNGQEDGINTIDCTTKSDNSTVSTGFYRNNGQDSSVHVDENGNYSRYVNRKVDYKEESLSDGSRPHFSTPTKDGMDIIHDVHSLSESGIAGKDIPVKYSIDDSGEVTTAWSNTGDDGQVHNYTAKYKEKKTKSSLALVPDKKSITQVD